MALAESFSGMDPWRPRKTRRCNYQSHTYKLRTPVVCLEEENGQNAIGLSASATKPPCTPNHGGGVSERTTSISTNQKGKNVNKRLREAEDVLLNRGSGSDFQNVSIQTMTDSRTQDHQHLPTADCDILDMAGQERDKRLSVKASSTPSPRQNRKKNQAQPRKQPAAKRCHTRAHKPTQPMQKCHSALVKVKLWEPHNVTRKRKDLSELDVCLSLYDQVVQDAIDNEDRPAIKKILLQHMKITRRALLTAVKEAHLLQLVEKRHQMEKTRRKRLQRDMQSTFKGLRKGTKQFVMKQKLTERSKRFVSSDAEKEANDDMFEQLKTLLALFDEKEMLLPESQSISE